MASQPRILVLGFGGTGYEGLIELKTLFAQNPGKVPPHCGLLYFDTVAPKDHGAVSLRDVECSLLLLRDPTEMLNNPANGYLREWFPKNIKVQTAVHGAAQIRPLGRLALHAQPERVLSQITNALNILTDRARLREADDGSSIDEQGSVEVYVLASLCGGTGSGIILDVARLVREQLRDAPTVRFVGVFLLPGPFRHLAGTGLVTANAYAALKELDYLADPREPVDFTFGPGRELTLDRSPFDLVYLVDSVGERYDTTKSVSQLARQMAYLPYLMATPSVGPHVREVLHNLIPQLESKELVHGKRATYASFGVAALELPRGSVLRARREFETGLLGKLLADAEQIQPLGDLGARDAVANCVVDRLPEHLEMLLLEVDFGNPREPVDKLENIYASTLNLVEDHARGVTEPHLRGLREQGERALNNLVQDVAVHPGRLPSALRECFRLQALLKSVLDSLRTRNEKTEHAEKERKRAWEACREAFKSRRRSKREPAANEWKEVVNSLVLPSRLVDTSNTAAADAIGFVIDRVREAEQWCTSAKRNVVNLLNRLSEEQILVEIAPNPFTRYGDAAAIRPRADARKFLADIPNVRSWFDGPEPAIRDALTAFSTREFDPAFLPGGASSATRLVLENLNKSITELRRFSDPMWSYSADKIPPEHHRGIHHLEVLGVDGRSGEAATIQAQYPAINVVQTGWSDRVVHLQIRAGIPLFALTSMNDLWRDYSRLSGGRGREICHIDRRWAGWPELLPHAFDPYIVGVFAQGFASSQIIRSGSAIEYNGNPTNHQLGDTFLQAYQTLCGDRHLVAAISRSIQGVNVNGTAERACKELWELLLKDGIAVHDRPLVEALLQSVESSLKRAQ